MIKGTRLTEKFDRRSTLMGLTAFAAAFGLGDRLAFAEIASTGRKMNAGAPFSREMVTTLARALAREAFVDRKLDLPTSWRDFSYDEYRDINFRADKAIWRGRNSPFEVQFFAPGGLFQRPVDIYLVERGKARALEFSKDFFSFGNIVSRRASLLKDEQLNGRSRRHQSTDKANRLTFSGFRLHSYVNQRKFKDEFTVFQGASYFRSVGKNQAYGLSARGLAIDTAEPKGEEFPYFRSFWIEQPSRRDKTITVHALLDSPSVTGAYKFVIRPGKDTIIDTELTLFPRRRLYHVGIAPLTSMYFYGYGKANKVDDFRPAVHDSEGLCILNGNGEWLWRPLINSRQLQISLFVDENPKGFGLIQRDRQFDHYQDLVARYDNRPSLWIEPKGEWGKGCVELIEIPTKSEIHDNIVAFWKPDSPLQPGQAFTCAYRMYWGRGARGKRPEAVVTHSLEGKDHSSKRRFIIDFVGRGLAGKKKLPDLIVSASGGEITHKGLIRHEVSGGLRANLVVDTKQEEGIDLRVGLYRKNRPVSEIWTYRWVAS